MPRAHSHSHAAGHVTRHSRAPSQTRQPASGAQADAQAQGPAGGGSGNATDGGGASSDRRQLMLPDAAGGATVPAQLQPVATSDTGDTVITGLAISPDVSAGALRAARGLGYQAPHWPSFVEFLAA